MSEFDRLEKMLQMTELTQTGAGGDYQQSNGRVVALGTFPPTTPLPAITTASAHALTVDVVPGAAIRRLDHHPPSDATDPIEFDQLASRIQAYTNKNNVGKTGGEPENSGAAHSTPPLKAAKKTKGQPGTPAKQTKKRRPAADNKLKTAAAADRVRRILAKE